MSRKAVRLPLNPAASLGIGRPGESIAFEIDHNEIALGQFRFDQHWMPLRTLRPTNDVTGNYSAVVNYFWEYCKLERSTSEQQVRESYLLARLWPSMRSQGAQRVVLASTIGRLSSESSLASRAAALEEFLAASRDQEMSMEDFRGRTGILIGPHELSLEEQSEYEEFSQELLDDALRQWSHGEEITLSHLQNTWDEWMRTIGRRSGNATQRRILDVLSYEAGAAFRRCYSETWIWLIRWLASQEGWSVQQQKFHRLWHLDICERASEDAPGRFHLFHGHIFALHPAMGPFLQTPTGRQQMANYLAVNTSDAEFRQLLHGLFWAVVQYEEAWAVQRLRRSSQARSLNDADFDSLAARFEDDPDDFDNN